MDKMKIFFYNKANTSDSQNGEPNGYHKYKENLL